MIELDNLPDLHDAVMIAAFEGWNDAGEAASAVKIGRASCRERV